VVRNHPTGFIMSHCPTVRIKSTVAGIDYFVINEADFDPEKHALLDAPEPDHPGSLKLADIKAELTAAGISIPRNASKAVCQSLLDEYKQKHPVAPVQ
jgi:hypothetical protein